MSDRNQVIAECKKIEPNPEHGPGQYGVVYDHMITEYADFTKWSIKRRVQTILDWMDMGELGQ